MQARVSDNGAGLVEIEARRTRRQGRRIAKADIAQEVRPHRAAGEESFIDRGIVESRHRSAVEPERAACDDQIGVLQGAVAERRLLDLRFVAFEPGPGVGVRIKKIGRSSCRERWGKDGETSVGAGDLKKTKNNT